MKILLWLICFSSICIFVVCQQKIDINSEQAKLLETDQEFSRMSVEKGAAEAFKFYLAQDALQLPQGAHPIQGRDSIYQGMIQNDGEYELRWEPKKAEVCQSGEMGYTWGIYTSTYYLNDEKMISHGKYLNIWNKQSDNSWKVLIDMGNSSPRPESSSKEQG